MFTFIAFPSLLDVKHLGKDYFSIVKLSGWKGLKKLNFPAEYWCLLLRNLFAGRLADRGVEEVVDDMP